MNKKLILFVAGALLIVPAFADEERGVAERTNCADARARIAEINAIAEPDDDTLAELDELNARVRRDCAVRNTRGASGRAKSAKEAAVDDVAAPTEEATEIPEPEPVVLDAKTVKENLAAGLCADGTKPNKYGCCTDEIFRDMGGMNFACCPKSGGDCFPPITGK